MSVTLNNITSGYSTGLINDNFQLVEDELNNNVLRRDGLSSGEANQMEVGLDMNSNFVYNLPEPVLEHQAARLQDVQNAINGADSANLITFTPYGNISSENVQGAIQELADGTGQAVTTSTGEQTLVEALDNRVIYVDSFGVLPSAGVTTGQVANVKGTEFEWDGTEWNALGAINVRTFGAVGDGVADDYQALQDAATFASGRTLFIPRGTYLVSQTVALPANIKIQGEASLGNSFSSKIETNGSFYALTTPAAVDFRLEVKNIALDCINGIDARSTERANVGLVSIDTVMFDGGDGTGVGINCLNHDFSKVVNCGFFWNGLCGIRTMGWYGTGGNKATTAMEISDNYFGPNMQIGVSSDIFESMYCERNDFGSVDFPVDIGGFQFEALTDGVSTNYFKRGETKPTEGYFGVGTNYYFQKNHIEGASTAITARGKGFELKSLHINENNGFAFDDGFIFARVERAVQSTFAENKVDFNTFTASRCFDYDTCIGVTFRDNHFFTRVEDGANNPNTFVDGGGNFFIDIRKGATGTAYNEEFIPSFTKLEIQRGFANTTSTSNISSQTLDVVRRTAGEAVLAQGADTIIYGARSGIGVNICGLAIIRVFVDGVGGARSVWAIGGDTVAKLSNDSSSGLYELTMSSGSIQLQGNIAGTNTYQYTANFIGIA